MLVGPSARGQFAGFRPAGLRISPARRQLPLGVGKKHHDTSAEGLANMAEGHVQQAGHVEGGGHIVAHGIQLLRRSPPPFGILVRSDLLDRDRSHLGQMHEDRFVRLGEFARVLVGELDQPDVAAVDADQRHGEPAA
jgi:hypothetical protein